MARQCRLTYLHIFGGIVERERNLVAQSAHRRHSCNGDQRCNQAIFNCGRTLIIAQPC